MSRSAAFVMVLFMVLWLGFVAALGVSQPRHVPWPWPQHELCTFDSEGHKTCVCLDDSGRPVMCEDEA